MALSSVHDLLHDIRSGDTSTLFTVHPQSVIGSAGEIRSRNEQATGTLLPNAPMHGLSACSKECMHGRVDFELTIDKCVVYS